MADNTTLDAGAGGDVIRTEDKAGSGIKTPVSLIDVAGTGAENLVEDGVQGMPTEGVAAENAAVVGNPVLVGGRYDATPRTLGDGDVGGVALDADGAVQISDGGNSITVDNTSLDNVSAGGTLLVNLTGAEDNVITGSVSVSAVTPGTTATSLGKAEDAAHSSGDTGVMSLAVRQAADSPLSGADGDYEPLQTDANGFLKCNLKLNGAIQDSNNTTTTPLAGDATFTGTSTETLGYATITIAIFADQNSATNGVSLEWSPDGTNWNHTAKYTYSASGDFSIGGSVRARYFRLVYTNGSTLQGTFRCYTFLHPVAVSHSIQPLEFTLTGQESAEMVRAVLGAKQTGGTYTNVGATNNGNLKVSLQEASDGLDIGAGNAGTETIRVSVATNDVNLSAIKTAVETLDNAIAGTEMQVDVVTSALPSGAATAANQSTANSTLSSIQTAVELIDNAIAGTEMQVDVVTSALPTGAATAANQSTANSTLSSIQTAVELIDNAIAGTEMQVDVVTSALPTGAATAANQSTANSTLSSIQTAVELIDNAIAGTEMQVDVVGSLPAGTNAIGKLAANSGVDIGDVDVTSIAAGSNLIGDVGIQGRTTGGLSIYYDNDLDETAVAVKAAAGTLYGMHVINTTAAPLYLQLFNVAQGSVTVGTTTPTVQFVVPGNADSDGAGFNFSLPQGIAFGTAITAAASTNSEGNGAPAANACHCNLFYK